MSFLAMGLFFTALSFFAFFFITEPIFFKVCFVLSIICHVIYFAYARRQVKKALE